MPFVNWSYALCPKCQATEDQWRPVSGGLGNTECLRCTEIFHDSDDGMWLFSNNQETFWDKYFDQFH